MPHLIIKVLERETKLYIMRNYLRLIVGLFLAGLLLFSSCKTRIDCPAYGKNHSYKKYHRV
jgi:hypothetical protein